MESPTATLAEQALGLDQRVVEAAGAGDPVRLRELLAGLDETSLIGAALVQTSQGLGRVCKHYLAHADPDGVREREADLVEKAGTRVINRRNGMVAILTEADPESAGYLITAMDARTSPRREVRF